MNDTESTRGTPHIDRAWRDAFVLALRLADVPGDRIGDALATVDTHCAESGETAAEAFGDPTAYARSLTDGQGGPALRPRTVVGIVAGLLGLLVLPRAVGAWLAGTAVQVTGGDLAAVLIVLALAGVVMIRPDAVLPWLLRRSWVPWVAGPALLTVLLVPQLLWQESLWYPSWPVPALLGVLALVLSVLLPWPDLTDADPIRDPRAGDDQPGATTWLTAFLFPILAGVLIAVDAVLRSLG
jgi:hypothetical protein